MSYLKLLAALIPIVLAIDLVWLGVIMKGFYAQELGDLARRSGTSLAPRWGAAILVYLLIPVGVMSFVRPLLGPHSNAWHAFGYGALFGLVMYGVYDLTNLAVLEKWTLRLALADMAWGCFLCGLTSVIMRTLDRWLVR